MQIHSVPTLIHGRVLVRPAQAATSRGLLVGFHGYMENAGIQMARLEELPDARRWTLASIQALHRFYRGRSTDVVASWMTREDRETAISDNLGYVAAALESVPHDPVARIVYLGFSQGVAMAFRAAVRGHRPAAAVIAVGGDVPPELLQESSSTFPRVLLVRGERDEWYTEAKLEADVSALTARAEALQAITYDGAHDWNAAVATAIGEYLSSL